MPQFNATLTSFVTSTSVKPTGYPRSMFSNSGSTLTFAPATNPLRINTPFTFDWWQRVDVNNHAWMGSAVVGGNNEWNMNVASTTNLLQIVTFGNLKNLTSASAFTLDVFHHIRYDFDGTTYRLYVDGTLQAALGGGAINESGIGGTPTGYLGQRPGNGCTVYTGQFAVFNVAFTKPGSAAIGDTVFTPPSAPWNPSLNGLTHLYNMDPTDPNGAGFDSADQNFTAPVFSPAFPVTISVNDSGSGNDIITVPAGAFTQGTYPLGSLALYEGTSPGAELAAAVATLSGSSGTFTRPTASGGTNYWRYVKAFDNEVNPAVSVTASNEVSSTAGGPVIPLTPSGSPNALRRTYADPLHATTWYNNGSFFLYPWRAYMDTWSVARYADSLGYNMGNVPDPTRLDWLAGKFAQFGAKRVRLSGSWGSSFDYTNTLTTAAALSYAQMFNVCKKYGVRPLILFDTNNGNPAPSRVLTVNVVTAGATNQNTLVIDGSLDALKVRPWYTGFSLVANSSSGSPPAKPLVTGVSGPDASGNYTLTFFANLPAAVPVGTWHLTDFLAAPILYSTTDGGAANARCLESLTYAQAAAKQIFDLATGILGPGKWDTEIVNELVDLSATWLDPTTSNNGGYGITGFPGSGIYRGTLPGTSLGTTVAYGPESLIAAITDVVRDPANGYGDVMVVNGASNQVPSYNGSGLFPGTDALSRHDYTGGVYALPRTMSGSGTEAEVRMAADGTPDGTPTGGGTDGGAAYGTAAQSTYFIPTVNFACPEFKYSIVASADGIFKELAPSASWQIVKINQHGVPLVHGRFSQNAQTARPFRAVQTENAYDRCTLTLNAATAAGKTVPLGTTDSTVLGFDNALAAKVAARTYPFFCNKGQWAEYMFAASGNQGSGAGSMFNLVPDTSPTGGAGGEVVRVMTNILTFMQGGDGLKDFGVCRYLGVSSVGEYNQQLVFAGGANQTKNPDMFNRDFLAILPFQSSLRRFVVPIYVAHPDMGKVWDSSKGFLDIARYTMTPQQFDITFTNVQGLGASIRLYDPTLDYYDSPSIVASTATTLTVRITVTDQPRILEIVEAQDGPSLQSVKAVVTPQGGIGLTWNSNCPVVATANRTTPVVRTATFGSGVARFLPTDTETQLVATAPSGVTVAHPFYKDDTRLKATYTPKGDIASPGRARLGLRPW